MRLNAHDLPSEERTIVDRLIKAGEPAGRIDLVRLYGRTAIDRLVSGGHLFEAMDGALFCTPLTIKELNSYPPWSADEEAQLRGHWATGLPVAEVARKLNRSGGDVLQYAWALKLGRGASNDDFEEFIPAWRIRRLRVSLAEAERRGILNTDDGEDLQHRALWRRFARGRALAENPKPANHHQPWTREDDRLLRAMRDGSVTVSRIAAVLKRTPCSVAVRISLLGLQLTNFWSETEDEILVEGYRRKATVSELRKLLPGRTKSGMIGRARVLGINGQRAFRPWTQAERDSLRAAYREGANVAVWAKANNRTKSGARHQARLMGLQHPAETLSRTYSEEENARIRRGYAAKEKVRAIAAELGRPASSVYCQAHKLGLTGAKAGYHRPVTEGELDKIRAFAAAGKTGRQIAEKIGRTLASTYRIANSRQIPIGEARRKSRKRRPDMNRIERIAKVIAAHEGFENTDLIETIMDAAIDGDLRAQRWLACAKEIDELPDDDPTGAYAGGGIMKTHPGPAAQSDRGEGVMSKSDLMGGNYDNE